MVSAEQRTPVRPRRITGLHDAKDRKRVQFGSEGHRQPLSPCADNQRKGDPLGRKQLSGDLVKLPAALLV